VLTGNAEFGSAGTATVLQAIRGGADLKIIAPVANSIHYLVVSGKAAEKMGVPETAPIEQRIRALKGLTIGTGSIGSTHHQILRSYLEKYGIDPAKDVKIVGAEQTTALISGLEHGRYGAIAYAGGVVEQGMARSAGKLWVSGPREDVPGSENIKTSVLFTKSETLDRHPKDADALRPALADALTKVHQDHAATGEALHASAFTGIEPNVWDVASSNAEKGYPTDLSFPEAAYQYWIENDPKGTSSYRNVKYSEVVYAPARTP
jgi:NitT/TauT family transport system substrate-binding protein